MHRFNMCEMLRLALLLICLIYIARTHAEDANEASAPASEDRSLLSSDVGKCISMFNYIRSNRTLFFENKCVHHGKCVFLEKPQKNSLPKFH